MSVAPTLSTNTEFYKTEQKFESPTIPPEQISEVYRVPQIAEIVNSHDYHNVCLQFPDNLVCDSVYIVHELQKKISSSAKVFVLADTTYSSCCVDEVASEHVNGDVVFHFCNACLNPCKSLPVYYIIPQRSMDLACIEAHLDDTTLLYADTLYTDIALKINTKKAIPAPGKGKMIPELGLDRFVDHPEFPNRKVNTTDPVTKVVYLSDSPSESLMLHWSTIFDEIKCINGKGEVLNVNAAIRKRYRYVQNIKAAGTVGILVNTLSLSESAQLLERIKSAVTGSGKKFYTFVVGKPNIAKLGNFEAIDIWVVIGCPQGGVIVDCDDYVKPIVTPYELELAFNDEWTGKWELRFGNVLLNEAQQVHKEEPLFDLVTGKFVFGNQPLNMHANAVESGDLELIKQSNALQIRNTVSTAAAKLQQKSWTGLGSDHTGDSEYAELKKGRSGIARHYDDDHQT